MEQQSKQNRNRRQPPLWKQIFLIALPVFAALLAASFVFFCALYLRVRPCLTVELGSDSPGAEAFLHGKDGEIIYLQAPQARYKEPGNHWLTVRNGRFTRLVLLRVRDTAAPKAEPVETTVTTKAAPTPDKLVKNLQDQSVLKLVYEQKPAYGR